MHTAAKAVFRKNFTAISVYMKKRRKTIESPKQTNTLQGAIRKEQIKPNVQSEWLEENSTV